MITIKFLTGWNTNLLPKSQNVELAYCQMTPENLKSVVNKILYFFDSKDYFYGLFQAMNYSGVSPFVATHDYCIKVLHASLNTVNPSPDLIDNSLSTIEMNISPIYHLGLEYPDNYKNRYGKELEEDAVIGLLTQNEKGSLEPSIPYSYGVDAGILFKNNFKIPHNKKITLKLEEIREGLLVTICCDKQLSSIPLCWADVGLKSKTGHNIRRAGTEISNGGWAVNE